MTPVTRSMTGLLRSEESVAMMSMMTMAPAMAARMTRK